MVAPMSVSLIVRKRQLLSYWTKAPREGWRPERQSIRREGAVHVVVNKAVDQSCGTESYIGVPYKEVVEAGAQGQLVAEPGSGNMSSARASSTTPLS